MIKVQILGVELEGNFLNADVKDLYDATLANIYKQAVKSENCKKYSSAIRMVCNAVIEGLDSIFGEGSAKKVLGEETDLLTCFDAFEELTDIYENYVDPLMKERSDKAIAKADEKIARAEKAKKEAEQRKAADLIEAKKKK